MRFRSLAFRRPGSKEELPSKGETTNELGDTQLSESAKRSDVHKPITSHTFRPSFATHVLIDGLVCVLFKSCWGTATSAGDVYTHGFVRPDEPVVSPLDVREGGVGDPSVAPHIHIGEPFVFAEVA
ncbi:MAG: hypothetical protein KDB27_03445 [Planctomycetales bacterium]|nr:hypothetical protein [Planctomycetales bacterium]